MPEFYYGVQEIGRATKRSPSSARQWAPLMPRPDAVLINGRNDVVGWTLASWREFAESRERGTLKEDLIAALDVLEREEQEHFRKYKYSWPNIKKKQRSTKAASGQDEASQATDSTSE